MSTSRRLLALAIVGALATACASDESSTSGPTLTSTNSTNSTTTTPPPTTPTTEPADTTTTTASDTTTTPPSTLPAGPADVEVPLFVGGAPGWLLYVGSWKFDAWSPAFDEDDNPVTPTVDLGAAATASNLGADTTGSLGPFAESCDDGREGPTIDIDLPNPEAPGSGYGAVVLPTPDWTLTPRPIAVTTTGPAAYQAIGEAAFVGDPVDPSQGSVQQVVVADLDGDGDDETIVVFEGVDESAIIGAPGDLAALLLVDPTTTASSTVEKEFVDVDFDTDSNVQPVIYRFRVIDVADYNGDGRMEVALLAWYFEGAGVSVYEYDGTQLVPVLRAACGS